MGEAMDNNFYDLQPKQKNQTEQISQQNSITQKEQKIIGLFLKGTLEETKTKVDSLVKGFSGKEQHLINYLNNLDYKDSLDDFMQIAEIKEAAQKQLGELKEEVENQNKAPFEIAGGQILTQNIDWRGGLKFSKGNKEWKELGDDKIQYLGTNKWEITMDNRGFSYNLVFEYQGGNIIKVHDERYGTVERITVTSKEISVQDMERKGYNKITIESYTKLREINIPFDGQHIRLQLIFHK